ncbi:alpha-amylase-like [Brevipalpus obovatus]|uniref:alpha-amylase-like n=1 Tax=Brevipalpus obovatus TaxID=246614 RepID=UPI003D9EA115
MFFSQKSLLVVCFLISCQSLQALTDNFDTLYNSKNNPTIVTLFEWNFDDVAEECEKFLGPYGYSAVQVSPVFEHRKIVGMSGEPDRAWYERYQLVSFKLISRSGTEEQFVKMVNRCNEAGVRVLVDLSLNHMSSSVENGVGVGGSKFSGHKKHYPEVPFEKSDFHGHSHCPTRSLQIENYNDLVQVRNCEHLGRHDLNHERSSVKDVIVNAVQKLLSAGVAGFKLDSARHIRPDHLKEIFQRTDLNHLYPEGSKPLLVHDVRPCCNYDRNQVSASGEYVHIGRANEYYYHREILEVFKKKSAKKLGNLNSVLKNREIVSTSSDDAIVFVDNAEFQREMRFDGINFLSPKELKTATAFMLAWPYGTPNIMSSYDWRAVSNPNGRGQHSGPPMDAKGFTSPIVRNSDLTCGSPWLCEHRWRQIYNMVKFRNFVGNEPVQNWITHNDDAISFSRGNKGFIAMNIGNGNLNAKTVPTGLPAGNYCDIITGNIESDGTCSGTVYEVAEDTTTTINIDGKSSNPMVALYVGARLRGEDDDKPMEPETPESDMKCQRNQEEDQIILDHCSICMKSLYNLPAHNEL